MGLIILTAGKNGIKIDLSDNPTMAGLFKSSVSYISYQSARITICEFGTYIDINYGDGGRQQISGDAYAQFKDPATGVAFVSVVALGAYFGDLIVNNPVA